MNIAIIGGGFTGLSAAFTLGKQGHSVSLFEKEKILGGLAGSVRYPGWKWQVEKHYHHWFTNDTAALGLIEELGLSGGLIFPKTLTSIYYNGRSYPFNGPLQVLQFSPLPFLDRVRTGLVTAYLKVLPKMMGENLEKYTASEWLRKYYGEKAYSVIWEPLIRGKFGPFAQTVNMAWFWARIKKRTLRLGYLKGGYKRLVDELEIQIKNNGGKIYTNTLFNPADIGKYDATIATTPSVVFVKMFDDKLKDSYKKNLMSIPHLHALNLLFITKEKILKNEYWLNVNDRSYPFIAVVQQTNMIDGKYYNGNHLTWVANYLPLDHPYLKMSAAELFAIYKPYLGKINPSFNFKLQISNFKLFLGPFAQPVFGKNYSHYKPDFTTPIPNVYLANMDMVYPWDRGTNYAIEMGEQIVEYVVEKSKFRDQIQDTS